MNRLRGITGPGIKVVGLTGGVASGKSTVAGIFESLGAIVMDFDLLAREVTSPGTPGFSGIVSAFGEEILNPEGLIDRKRLSSIVFADKKKRELLESITHPLIFDAFFKELAAICTGVADGIIMAEVPLLFELNLSALFFKTVLVYVDLEEQVKRLVKRDGIGEDAALCIIGSQMPLSEKKALCDFLIDNTKDLASTRIQVERTWRRLTNP